METKTGKINKVETKETYIGIPYKKVEIDGTIYECFENDLFNSFIEGQTITFDYQKGRNNFLNIKQIHANESETQALTTQQVVAPLPQSPSDILIRIQKLEREVDVLQKQLFNHMADEWGHKI